MDASLVRVKYHVRLETQCLLTDTTDVNTVTVSLPSPSFIDAEAVQKVVQRYAGERITAEALAVALISALRSALPLLDPFITVVVRQDEGHGVEAEAIG